MGFANQIKVTVKLLNCRLQPSMSAKILGTIKMDEIHNIVAEQNGWGQLENGSWINLEFTAPYQNNQEVIVEENKVKEQVAIISTTESMANVAIPENNSKQSKPKYKLHKVKKGGISGESLWDIAEQYLGKGERYTEIKTLNDLKSDILRAGMVLKIPNN